MYEYTTEVIQEKEKSISPKMLDGDLAGTAININDNNRKIHTDKAVINYAKRIEDNSNLENDVVGIVYLNDKVFNCVTWGKNDTVYKYRTERGTIQYGKLRYIKKGRVEMTVSVDDDVNLEDDFTQFKQIGKKRNPFDSVKDGLEKVAKDGYASILYDIGISDERRREICSKIGINDLDFQTKEEWIVTEEDINV